MYFSDRLKNEILQVVKQKSGCSIYIHLFPPISYLVWTCNICTKNTQLYCFSMRVENKSHSRSPLLFSFLLHSTPSHFAYVCLLIFAKEGE